MPLSLAYQAFVKATKAAPGTPYPEWSRKERSVFHAEKNISEAPCQGETEAEHLDWLVLEHNAQFAQWLKERHLAPEKKERAKRI